jgi:hypothetical protein
MQANSITVKKRIVLATTGGRGREGEVTMKEWILSLFVLRRMVHGKDSL